MIGATIRKDLQLLLRDRGALLSLFALPIVFIVVFGSIFRFGGDRSQPRPLPVWHQPGDARALTIVAAIEASGAFAPQRHDSPEAVRSLVSGHLARNFQSWAPVARSYPATTRPRWSSVSL